jgi:hypothetical protein
VKCVLLKTFTIDGTVPIYKKIKIIKLCTKLNIDYKNNKIIYFLLYRI